jgi:hypothetical protein
MEKFSYGNIQDSNCPSPEAYIKISNPLNYSKSCRVKALIDSGAAMTCVPESTIKRLGHNLDYNEIGLRDANNRIETRKLYTINIDIGTYTFQDFEVIAIPKSYALIGRDILNQSRVMLDANYMRWIYDCPGRCLDEDEDSPI